MVHARVGSLWAGILLCAGLAAAQDRPNFSGTWVPISPDDNMLAGPVQTVVHTEATLTLGHASGRGGHRFVYRLDGSENRSTLMNVESVAIATWLDRKLTIARIDHYPDGRIRENTQVWSMDADRHLVVESIDGLKGATPTTMTRVYRHQSAKEP